jgi:hypothetical protein
MTQLFFHKRPVSQRSHQPYPQILIVFAQRIDSFTQTTNALVPIPEVIPQIFQFSLPVGYFRFKMNYI